MAGGERKKAKAPARVFIVDDHPVVIDGLAALLATEPDLELCGQADAVADALARIRQVRLDVAVIDISLKDGTGIDLIKRLRAHDRLSNCSAAA
ncbi:MAG TPA: response regulator transcription factor [Gemmataceae bacterium]